MYFLGRNSASKEELITHNDCGMIIARAESFLDDLITSVKGGTVTIAKLKVLEKHSKQFLKLGEIHQKNKKVPVSVKDSFQKRLSQKKAFFTLRDHLECFMNYANIFTSGTVFQYFIEEAKY